MTNRGTPSHQIRNATLWVVCFVLLSTIIGCANKDLEWVTSNVTISPLKEPTPTVLVNVQKFSDPSPVPFITPRPVGSKVAASGNDPFTDKGCLLLQNQLGIELTFIFSNTNGSFNEVIRVNSDDELPYCLDPGYYTVTIDAPSPWADITEEFILAAGDRFYFPVRPAD